jgi:mRNA interferase HigB
MPPLVEQDLWVAQIVAVKNLASRIIRERQLGSHSFLANNIVVFNVKGNDYRLEVLVAYKTSVVLVQWIGTHAEYDARNKAR